MDYRTIQTRGVRYQGAWYTHPVFASLVGLRVGVRRDGTTLTVHVQRRIYWAVRRTGQ